MNILNYFGKISVRMDKSDKKMTIKSSTEMPSSMNKTGLKNYNFMMESSIKKNEMFVSLNNISEYKNLLEKWMQNEKPYMDKNFRLLDVMKILPLNRSYLSRMFNEGYGETFLAFVMRYRIEESTRLLAMCPDLTIASIALSCGFSSASVFGRAFLKNKGMTPKQYRILHQKSEKNTRMLNG